MQGKPARKNIFAALLLTISFLSLTPTLAHANQQKQSYAIMNASAVQATTIGNSTSGTAIPSNYTASNTSVTNQNGNSTMALESLHISQNATETNAANVTSTYHANSTLPTDRSNNTAPTVSANASTPYISQTSGNITVTVTQYFSVTTSTTVTVENSTINYTMTTTVANTTITQSNATTTVTAITGT